MRKRKIVFAVLLLLVCYAPYAQTGSAVVKGYFYTKDIESFDLIKSGLRSHLTRDPDIEAPLEKNKSFIARPEVTSPCFYKVGDLFQGHIIFLEPGDTINIRLNPLPGLVQKQQKGEMVTKAYALMVVQARYPGNITFFDALEKKIGVTIKYKFEKPADYKRRCDKAYATSRDLLNLYQKQKKISPAFYQYTEEELKARYVLWMGELLLQKDRKGMPESLFGFASGLSFNDSVYAIATPNYMTAAAVKNYYIDNHFNPKNYYQNLDREFATIIKNYTGLLRDRLLGWQVEDYVGKEHPAFDSCYQVFLSMCRNPRIRSEVVKKVMAYVKPSGKGKAGSFYDMITETNLQTPDNKTLRLNSLLADSSLILVDCWATWCIPCREQMPFIHDIEKKYAGKLKVVYLSFDKDELKWKNFVDKNKLHGNQYLMSNEFSSLFARYFNLESIPRYILLSGRGPSVLNDKMPLPALEEEFAAELNKYL